MTAISDGKDTVRTDIRAAMDRLLAGTPARSDGKLTVAELALEAGVKRHNLTHKHTDLKDEFYGRVAAQTRDPSHQSQRQMTKMAELLAHNAKLLERLREAQMREQGLIRELQLLAVENDQLRRARAVVSPLRRR